MSLLRTDKRIAAYLDKRAGQLERAAPRDPHFTSRASQLRIEARNIRAGLWKRS